MEWRVRREKRLILARMKRLSSKCFVFGVATLLCGVASGQAKQSAKLFCLFLVFFGIVRELNPVVVAAAMAHQTSRADRSSGKRRRKLNQHFVAGLELHAGKHQDAAFRHISSPAGHYFGRSVLGMNEPDRKIEPVPLPASENRSFS
jgi:hypothetical protein